MSSDEDENDSGLEQKTAFSARLQKFNYIPPSEPASSKPLPEQAFAVPSAMATLQAAVKNEEARPPLEVPGAKKRKLNGGSDSPASPSLSPLKRRTTTKERSVNDPYEPENNLVDSLRPGMMLVFCGLK
jgi:hypothetical protein